MKIHNSKYETTNKTTWIISNFSLNNVIVVFLTCITYIPKYAIWQLQLCSFLYVLYLIYMNIATNRAYIIAHYLNIAYLVTLWLAVYLRKIGIELGYLFNLLYFLVSCYAYYLGTKGSFLVTKSSLRSLITPMKPPKESYFYGFLCSFVLIIYSLYVPMNFQHQQTINLLLKTNIYIVWFVGILFSFINAFWEEILFREFYLKAYNQGNKLLIWIGPSIVFSIIHYQNGFPHGFIGLGLTFIFALMMLHLRLKYSSLFPSYLIHVLCDFIIFIALLWNCYN